MKSQKEKRRVIKKILILLLKICINNPEQSVGRNMDAKSHSQEEIRNPLLDNGGNAIFVLNWQRSWLKRVFVLVLRGRLNFQVIKLNILLMKS